MKLRRFLFWGFSLFFLILAGYLLFTAQGWVVDLKHFKFVKTGALFLKFSPSDANVVLNGKKPQNISSGLIQKGNLIKDLAPGNYKISISKTGYQKWEKRLEVKSGFVTSASQIKLWPEKIKPEILMSQNVKDFWLSENGIIYADPNQKLMFDETQLKGKEMVLAEAGSKTLITKEKETFFLIDLANPKNAINLSYLFNSLKERQLGLPGTVQIKQVFLHPFGDNKLIISSPTSVYVLDTKKFQIEKLITEEEIKNLGLSNSEVFVINQKGELTAINLVFKTKTRFPLFLPNVSEMKINSPGTKIFFLNEEKNLMFFNRNEGRTVEISKDVNQFYLSPEEKRLALVKNNQQLDLFYLLEYQSDVKYAASTTVNLVDEKINISDFSWLPGLNYSLVLENENLKVYELDVRPNINSYLLVPEIKIYRWYNNKVYGLLKNGSLIKINLNEIK